MDCTLIFKCVKSFDLDFSKNVSPFVVRIYIELIAENDITPGIA